jgi:hypothetical protein
MGDRGYANLRCGVVGLRWGIEGAGIAPLRGGGLFSAQFLLDFLPLGL